MSQQIINYDEEMVGANHPTKSDTLNRAFLISHADNGGFRNGAAFPASGLEDRMYFYRTDEERLYVYDLGGAAWQAVGGLVAAGTYTGDGNSTKSVTGLGFLPAGVLVMRHRYAGNQAIAFSWSDGYGQAVTGGGLISVDGGGYITSLDSDGFTVNMTGNLMNSSGDTYTYLAWRAA